MKNTYILLFTAFAFNLCFGQTTFTKVLVGKAYQGTTHTHADFDNDGDIDFVTYGSLAGTFTGPENMLFFRNNGSLEFEDAIVLSDLDFKFINDLPNVVDYDFDGDLDLLYITNSNLSLLRNDGNANFVLDIINENFDYAHMLVFDNDNDGDMDIACEKVGFSNNDLVFLTNNGDDTFEESILRNLEPSDWNNDMDLIDFDLDGDFDFFRTSLGNNTPTLEYYLNNGDGTFTEKIFLGSFEMQGTNTEIIDINADGKPDLIVSTDLGLYEILNRSSGIVIASRISDEFMRTFTPGDFDGDGDIDVFTSSTGNDLEIYYLNEFFFYMPSTIFGEVSSFFTSSALDIDGDGDLDIVASDDDLVIFINDLLSSNEAVDLDKTGINIMPNPTSENIRTSINLERAMIYDLNGRLVQSVNNPGNSKIDIGHLESGIYILEAYIKDRKHQVKFIKQ